MRFTSTFSPQQPCECVYSKEHRQAFYSPEPNVHMVMVIRNPRTTRTAKDGTTSVEILDHELKDDVLAALVRHVYKLFTLFNGRMDEIMTKFSLKTLRDKLELFIPECLQSIDFPTANVFDALHGIHFLPVNKETYLLVQCFINLTENAFPAIRSTAFLYDDHLIWSGLGQDDMRAMYHFLVKRMEIPEMGVKYRSGFVVGPKDLADDDTPLNSPLVYIGEECEEYRLVVYQQERVHVVFLVDPAAAIDLEFFRSLSSSIHPAIANIQNVIEKQEGGSTGGGALEEQYRFIYFNHINLALKTSLKTATAKRTGGNAVTISRETMSIISDLHEDLKRSREPCKEMIIRTQGDGWIVGRRSDQREFYVLFEQRNANLVDIGEEMRRLGDTFFRQIFISM